MTSWFGNIGERYHAFERRHIAHIIPDVGVDVARMQHADGNPVRSGIQFYRAGEPVEAEFARRKME
jgi:hypothetical protein